ncbi:MAG: hypothetical protein HOO67_04925 [Candidatus Peribacteraceae bacterium]|nr:hypothetical protein [Candidatus Peribacteraceae bacterium]
MSFDRRTPLAVFLLLLFSYAYINQGWGWNQNSRLDVLHALFVKHTITIDAYEENTGDKEKLNGHFYSEKAPGMILVAAPAFLLAYGTLHLSGINIDGATGWKISDRVTTAGSVGLLAALGGMCLFLLLRRRMDPRLALIATLAVFLGSLPFPYATMMFSHGAIMGLFAIALWVFDLRDRHPKKGAQYDYLLGFLCGLAVSCEYPAAIGAGMFFLLTLLRGWKSAARFVAASILPLLTIPLYNWAVSGSFLSLGYGRVDFAGMQDGFFGVTLPKSEAVRGLLFSHFRGLFFWSPFLLLSAVGYPVLYRRSQRLFWMTLLVPVAYVCFATSYAYWDGGFAFGPRHLSAAVPFLAIAAAFGLEKLSLTGTALAAASILMTTFATFVNAMPPNEFHRPLFEFYPRDFSEGKMAWNLGRSLGLSGAWGMAVWAAISAVAVTGIFYQLRERRKSAAAAKHVRSWSRAWAHLHAMVIRWSRTISRIRFSPSSWIPDFRRLDPVRTILWIAIIGAISLRFVHLPLMEFKGDEFDVLIRAWRNAHGVEFATTSIPSSVGLVNPPFFVWLLSIPAFFTSDPVLVTAFVAAVNAAGLLLLYAFLKRAFSANTALWTTALLSTAPWAIIYSRKLWPQDVMIFFLVLLYFALFLMMKRYRPWHVYLLFFTLAAVTQLHLIAWILPLIFFLFFDIFRVPIRKRDLLGGLSLFALLYLPYLFFHQSSSFLNLLDFLRDSHESLNIRDILEHLEWSVAATSGLKFAAHIGDDAYALFLRQYFGMIPVLFFITYAFGVAIAFAALAREGLRNIRLLLRPLTIEPGIRILLLLIAVYAVIIGIYALIGAPPYTQYHIIFYPLMPLVLVFALERAVRSRFFPSALAHSLLLLIVLSNLAFSAGFIHFLGRNPEKIGAGYGKPYALEWSLWEQKIHLELSQ